MIFKKNISFDGDKTAVFKDMCLFLSPSVVRQPVRHATVSGRHMESLIVAEKILVQSMQRLQEAKPIISLSHLTFRPCQGGRGGRENMEQSSRDK